MTELGIPYAAAEWPHGLRCGDCHVLFVEGMRYSERFDGVIPPETVPSEDGPQNAPEWLNGFLTEPTAVVHIVCVACALTGEPS